MPLAAGSLKLVVASTDPGVIEQALRARFSDSQVLRLTTTTFVVYTDAEPAAIRDWLSPHLAAGESLLVVEFERWSTHGGALDRAWLTERGH